MPFFDNGDGELYYAKSKKAVLELIKLENPENFEEFKDDVYEVDGSKITIKTEITLKEELARIKKQDGELKNAFCIATQYY